MPWARAGKQLIIEVDIEVAFANFIV